MTITKECRTCRSVKLITEFYSDRRTVSGTYSSCKLCTLNRQHSYLKSEKGKANRSRYLKSHKKKEADRRYLSTKRGYLIHKYSSMKTRVEGRHCSRTNKIYEGLPIMSKKSFIEWALSDEMFSILWDTYVRADNNRALSPSIDRIDPRRGYVKGNVRFITQSENSRRDYE